MDTLVGIPAITAIILDLGDVLLEWSTDSATLAGVPLGSMTETQAWRDHQMGLVSAEDCYRMLGEAFALPATKVAATMNRLRDSLKVNERLVRSIEQLKHNRPDMLVIALSNISKLDIDHLRAAFPAYMAIFDRVYASGEVGMLKPDLGFYRLVLERVGVEAQQMLFIDDKQANVDSAVEMGMHGLRFTGMDDLEKELSLRYSLPCQ